METDDRLEYLRAHGRDRAQGYLIARPLPVEDAEALLFAPAPRAGRDALTAQISGVFGSRPSTMRP